jgi:hypothetical protein
MPGWGGRDRTSEWRNQNQLDYPTRRIWKKRPKRPLATSIAWQPFPNKEAALAGSISPAKSGAAGCAQTLKSLGVEGIYIDALRDVQATDPSNSHPAAGPFRRRGGCRERCKRGPPHRETHFHQSSVFISSGSLMDQQSPFGSIADRIVDMDSAWKSPNSAMRTISVLTLCGLLAAQPERPRRLGEFVDYGSPAWRGSGGRSLSQEMGAAHQHNRQYDG